MRALLCIALIACSLDRPPSIDGGYDPSLDSCCLWFVLPWRYDRPQVCLEEHTDVSELPQGSCRWLTCLGGLKTYTVCNR